MMLLAAMAMAAQAAPDGEVHVQIGVARGACTLKVNDARADIAQLGTLAKGWAEAGLSVKLEIDEVPDRCGIMANKPFRDAGFELNENVLYIPNHLMVLDVPVAGEVKLAAPCALTINGAPATFEALAALAPRWSRQVVDVHFEPLSGAQPDCAERVRTALKAGGLGNFSDDAPGGIETFQSADAM